MGFELSFPSWRPGTPPLVVARRTRGLGEGAIRAIAAGSDKSEVINLIACPIAHDLYAVQSLTVPEWSSWSDWMISGSADAAAGSL